MKKLVIASANLHKISEIYAILGPDFPVISMKEIGCEADIPETSGTIEGNAIQKADYIWNHYRVDCFSDDSGLEIDALGGKPGVNTAHYAGPERNADANMDLVLQQLEGADNRKARFRTVIALWWKGSRHTFEGIVEGNIAASKRGETGFGYDPIFQPEGYDLTFAEMTDEIKNSISHRYRALMALKAFLEQSV